MTKTQALQRLYKALTGNEGRNTGSKVIEDLAVAAENGEIGGGGKTATVSFSFSDVSPEDVTIQSCRIDSDGILVPIPETPLSDIGTTLTVPLAGNGVLIQIGTSGDDVTTEGAVEPFEDDWYIITGDCEFTISDGGK